MNNLLDFLSRHYHWFLFVFLEVICAVLLFQYNNYQSSVWFSSANVVTGKVYEVNSKITQFFSLVKLNEELTHRNVYLEQQVQALYNQLEEKDVDTTLAKGAGMKVLEHFRVIPAKVVSNSVDKKDNLITIDKGEADGVRKDMGVVCGTGVVGQENTIRSSFLCSAASRVSVVPSTDVDMSVTCIGLEATARWHTLTIYHAMHVSNYMTVW